MLTTKHLTGASGALQGQSTKRPGLGPGLKTNHANLAVQVLATWKRNEAAWLTSESCKKTLECYKQGVVSITRSQAQRRQQLHDLWNLTDLVSWQQYNIQDTNTAAPEKNPYSYECPWFWRLAKWTALSNQFIKMLLMIISVRPLKMVQHFFVLFFNSENEAGLPHSVLEYLILMIMPNQFYFLKYTNMPTNTGKIKVSQLSSM